MKVLLRTGGDELLAFGEVDEGDGYDGTPIVEWEGRYFTGTGIVTPEGYRVYAERVVRKVVADPVWGKAVEARDALRGKDPKAHRGDDDCG